MYSSADDDKVEGDDRPLRSMDEIEVVATGEGSSVVVESVKATDGWSIYATSNVRRKWYQSPGVLFSIRVGKGGPSVDLVK